MRKVSDPNRTEWQSCCDMPYANRTKETIFAVVTRKDVCDRSADRPPTIFAHSQLDWTPTSSLEAEGCESRRNTFFLFVLTAGATSCVHSRLLFGLVFPVTSSGAYSRDRNPESRTLFTSSLSRPPSVLHVRLGSDPPRPIPKPVQGSALWAGAFCQGRVTTDTVAEQPRSCCTSGKPRTVRMYRE